MDPLVILAASIFIILLASFIVNFYYICGYYLHHMDYVTTTTQTQNFFKTQKLKLKIRNFQWTSMIKQYKRFRIPEQ